MSEKEEKKEFLCNWCDTLTNSIVKEYEHGHLVWVGCADCFIKQRSSKNEKRE